MGGKKRLIKKGYKDTLKNHQQFWGGVFLLPPKETWLHFVHFNMERFQFKSRHFVEQSTHGEKCCGANGWKKKKEILKHKQLYRALDSLCLKEGGERRAWQGLIRSCNNYNNIFIKLINWESRGNCYVCCRLTMLLMLTTVKMTNNKL